MQLKRNRKTNNEPASDASAVFLQKVRAAFKGRPYPFLSY